MSEYFSKVPDFEYVSRLPGANISDYVKVKNFFKKVSLRQDIYSDLTFFTKYQILGNDRPDNVAYRFYGDSTLDWVVLMSNNIINIQEEWPMSQFDFDNYLLKKYGTYENLNSIKHYETIEVRSDNDVLLVPAGLIVESTYSIEYFENGGQVTKYPVVPITNYQYEEKLNENKRNIFLLKPRYIGIITDDLEEEMSYEKGSSQYVTRTLKRADNIRLFS